MITLKHMNTSRLLLLACTSALALSAHAVELMPRGAFVQGGVADHGGYSATAGVLWPWAWRREALGGEFTGLTEAYLSHWSGRVGSERRGFTQVGVMPMLRYRFAGGRSDWFAEAGIGISAMDRPFRTDHKQFSTSFNFVDVISAGRSFGERRDQEISLRVTHFSNAGIKKPNPGENFLQLRYARMF